MSRNVWLLNRRISYSLLLFEQLLFFFKQKTAYEMRISDWSSDVCSSDLLGSSVVWADVTTTTTVPAPPSDTITQTSSAQVPATGEVGVRQLEIGRASCRERVCQYV